MFVTLAGRLTLVRLRHCQNAVGPRRSTPSGIVTRVTPCQFPDPSNRPPNGTTGAAKPAGPGRPICVTGSPLMVAGIVTAPPGPV